MKIFLKEPDDDLVSKFLILLDRSKIKNSNFYNINCFDIEFNESIIRMDWYRLILSPQFLKSFWDESELVNINTAGSLPQKIQKWKWIRNYMIEESDKGIHPIEFLYQRIFVR